MAKVSGDKKADVELDLRRATTLRQKARHKRHDRAVAKRAAARKKTEAGEPKLSVSCANPVAFIIDRPELAALHGAQVYACSVHLGELVYPGGKPVAGATRHMTIEERKKAVGRCAYGAMPHFYLPPPDNTPQVFTIDPRSPISTEPPRPTDATIISKQREEIQHWMNEDFKHRTALAEQKAANALLADRASDDAHVAAARLELEKQVQKILHERIDHLERELRLARRPSHD